MGTLGSVVLPSNCSGWATGVQVGDPASKATAVTGTIIGGAVGNNTTDIHIVDGGSRAQTVILPIGTAGGAAVIDDDRVTTDGVYTETFYLNAFDRGLWLSEAGTVGQTLTVTQTGTGTAQKGADISATGAGTYNTGLYVTASGATNNYGLRVAGPGAGANNLAIWADAGANSLFAGKLLTTAGLGVGNTTAATALANADLPHFKMEVFDAAGASVGFIPIYPTGDFS